MLHENRQGQGVGLRSVYQIPDRDDIDANGTKVCHDWPLGFTETFEPCLTLSLRSLHSALVQAVLFKLSDEIGRTNWPGTFLLLHHGLNTSDLLSSCTSNRRDELDVALEARVLCAEPVSQLVDKLEHNYTDLLEWDTSYPG